MSFWRIFHNLVRQDDSIEETKRATEACIWLTENVSNLRKVCTVQQIEILTCIGTFWYNNKLAPSYAIVRETLERNSATIPGLNETIAEYEEEREELAIHSVNDLGQLLDDFEEDWRCQRLQSILSVVKAINNGSWKDPKTKKAYSGSKDAVKFFFTQAEAGLLEASGRAVSGALNDTAMEIIDLYEKIKVDKLTGRGRIQTGLPEIDNHISIRPGNFVGVLGYAGQRKSTVCRTMAYNAVKQGFNVLHVSLEETYDDERVIYALMHSKDPKFNSYNVCLSRKKFDDGTFSPTEEKFLYEVVLPDLEKNLPGRLLIRQPTNGTTWLNIRTIAEIINQTTPIDLFLVDYLAMVTTSNDSKGEMEQNIKDAKQLALNFDGGRGLVFLTPIQGNRKGYEAARDAGGVWDITGVNLYSEFDKSADIIFTNYFDQNKEGYDMLMSTVKIRRAAPLPLITVVVDTDIGMIRSFQPTFTEKSIFDQVHGYSLETNDV